MPKNRNLKERIKLNDLTEFEEWALAVMPILIMIALILGAYLIVWW
ncbi:MAG: hypothetical protein FD141_390 [Fusobacteria bacterium]|nr:MAG: hypothetical protein FD141_390 [Fusobacteriota bacterium]KAF0228945.1 MAG: hypothetical protein FD182_1201 [Fusobacteriota bacterium]